MLKTHINLAILDPITIVKWHLSIIYLIKKILISIKYLPVSPLIGQIIYVNNNITPIEKKN
jgi:hypothetical protein